MSEVKNVTITVPVGLNGWQQTGSVVINGMKVEFPVGEETQVPETAAALLNELIEAAEKRAEDAAKPNNHYVGAVTIPAGKHLTLEDGAEIKRADKVILPKTVPDRIENNNINSVDYIYTLTTPWTTEPHAGAVWIINYNGTDYECKAIDAKEFSPEMIAGKAFAFGYPAALGDIEHPDANPNAPFVMLAMTNEFAADEGAYAIVYPVPTSTPSVTLSIVEKGEAVSVGGVRVITMTVANTDENTGEIYLNSPLGYSDIKNLIAMGVVPIVRVAFDEENYYLSLVKDSVGLTFSMYADGISLMLSVAETTNNGETGTVCVLIISGV